MVDIRETGRETGRLLLKALMSMLLVWAGFFVVGCLLAFATWWWLSDIRTSVRVSAAVVVMMEALAAGAWLGWQWAAVTAVHHGLRTWKPCGAIVRGLFSSVRRIVGEDKDGGQRVEKSLRKVPLEQAERLMTDAVLRTTGGVERTGWFQQRIQRFLLARVHQYTLSRFRANGRDASGIDLDLVQQEVEQSIDEFLPRKLFRATFAWTILLFVLLPLIVAIQCWAITAFF